MWKKIIFAFVIMIAAVNAQAQQMDFCNAVDSVIAAAKSKFVHVKGQEISNSNFGISWESRVQIPGNIRSRIVSSMGTFYEGALYQTKDKETIGEYYDRYEALLDSCLVPQGYKLSKAENFNKGIEHYKKLVYMNMGEDAAVPPPHVSMEVDFYKPTGIYTMVLYVWEH